eukprot:TRINITY_DN9204_c0_g1_i1.p1 TRINITY_DN9204_c0_g1~~TRINITY_DN9204_c0_g1_i1.p1  ORF type:complete len:583 (-),score=162.24 TRINITY_DN9204_c0_g1_i1:6-1754(-)
MFWGIKLYPDQDYVQNIPSNCELVLCSGCCEQNYKNFDCTIQIIVKRWIRETQHSIVIGVLDRNTKYLNLSHVFSEDENIIFSVSCSNEHNEQDVCCVVHLSGYLKESSLPTSLIPTTQSIKEIMKAGIAELLLSHKVHKTKLIVHRCRMALPTIEIEVTKFDDLFSVEKQIMKKIFKHEKEQPLQWRLRRLAKRRNGTLRPYEILPKSVYHLTLSQLELSKLNNEFLIYLEQDSPAFPLSMELDDSENPLFLTLRFFNPFLREDESYIRDLTSISISSIITLLDLKEYICTSILPELLVEEVVLCDQETDHNARILNGDHMTLQQHLLTMGDIVVIERKRFGHKCEEDQPTVSLLDKVLKGEQLSEEELKEIPVFGYYVNEESSSDTTDVEESSDVESASINIPGVMDEVDTVDSDSFETESIERVNEQEHPESLDQIEDTDQSQTIEKIEDTADLLEDLLEDESSVCGSDTDVNSSHFVDEPCESPSYSPMHNQTINLDLNKSLDQEIDDLLDIDKQMIVNDRQLIDSSDEDSELDEEDGKLLFSSENIDIIESKSNEEPIPKVIRPFPVIVESPTKNQE